MTAPPEGDEAEGTITPSFEEGALLLRDEDGAVFRLSWEKRADEEAPADRRRGLGAGTYDLVGYRIAERPPEGEVWHISATGKSIREIVVKRGDHRTVEIDETIHVRRRLHEWRVGMQVLGEHKAGLSIYRDGRRIPIHYRLLDEEGREVRSGRMNYG